MNNNVQMVQKQIKAFNKAFSRAEKANIISSSYQAQIYDLIDTERMTKSGYGMAGTKYLSSLSEEELMAYSADIERASQYIQIEKIQLKYDIEAIDLESLLWKMYDETLDRGYPFDSDQVKDAADHRVDPVEMIIQMDKYISDKNYGAADFHEWWDSLESLR